MSTSSVSLSPLEINPVGRKPVPRKRARDDGTVMPLGVEISAAIWNDAERCRAAKKWSKRTLVEEALRQYLAAEGFLTEEDGKQ